jgi:hypothetical protein
MEASGRSLKRDEVLQSFTNKLALAVPEIVETPPTLGAYGKQMLDEQLRVSARVTPDILNPLKQTNRGCLSNVVVTLDV